MQVREAIMEGRPMRGMTKAEVREAFGNPTSTYTDSAGYEHWQYSDSRPGGYRGSGYTFRGGLLDRWDDYRAR
jgi:hypothetical protein